jgi:pimeloyl-ACP methyl ester carboxylesterase
MDEVQALMAQLTPDWRGWHTVPNAGHWVQYEAPEEFNVQLISLLASGMTLDQQA